MSSHSLRFTETEVQRLRAFFEQLHLDNRKFKNDEFICKTEEQDTVFIFSWEGSAMGWHDESWYDIASFTLTKTYMMSQSDLEPNDKLVSGLAEQAESICITEQTFRRGFRFKRNDMVIYADGFLGITERVKIVYYSCNGEW